MTILNKKTSKKSHEEIIILSEAYNPAYFRSFQRLNQQLHNKPSEVIALNFIVKHPFKEIKSLLLIPKLFYKNQIIVLAIAPLSPLTILYLILFLIKSKKIIFYTSWPYWDKKEYRWNIFPKIYIKIWNFFIKKSRLNLCINQAALQYCKSLSKKSFLIPHSIDTAIYKHNSQQTKFATFTCLFVGRLIEEKGVKSIIRVARKLPEIHFIFVGKGPLRDHIIHSGLSNIKYVPHIDDSHQLVNLYNKSHVLLLPSFRKNNWEEFFGIVIIEAMACGLPVIATDCIGPSSIIHHVKDGLLIKQKDDNSLKKAINTLCFDRRKYGFMSKKAQITGKKYDTNLIAVILRELIYQ